MMLKINVRPGGPSCGLVNVPAGASQGTLIIDLEGVAFVVTRYPQGTGFIFSGDFDQFHMGGGTKIPAEWDNTI